ncbi:MAG: hypothetical protein RL591_513 [Planctomycetota bacterium]|jgi:hypothetical protein
MFTLARSKLVCALLATMAGALTGCHVVRPEGRATELRLGQTNGDLTEVVVVLELRNPGRDEIDLVEYDYTVSLADGSRYGGRWAALRALPPGQTVEAMLPAVLPTTSLADGMAWSASGTGKYRDPNSVLRILYEAGILKNEYSFSTSGTKKFSKAASTSAVAPAATPAATPDATPAATPTTTPAATPTATPAGDAAAAPKPQ